MKKLEIECNWSGFELLLYDGEQCLDSVRFNADGCFEGLVGGEAYAFYHEPLLDGAEALERRLNALFETSAKLWTRDENYRWYYKGFDGDEGLDGFLAEANAAFDELRELLRGEYEVKLLCRTEREFWLAGNTLRHGQKRRLSLAFEWGQPCLWLHDEYGCLIANIWISTESIIKWSGDGYPDELLDEEKALAERFKGHVELLENIDWLCEEYDSLFIDTEREFAFKGFPDREHAEDFTRLLSEVWRALNELLGGEYSIFLRESLDPEKWQGERREC